MKFDPGCKCRQIDCESMGRGVAGVLPKDLSERSDATPVRRRPDRRKGSIEARVGCQVRVASAAVRI